MSDWKLGLAIKNWQSEVFEGISSTVTYLPLILFRGLNLKPQSRTQQQESECIELSFVVSSKKTRVFFMSSLHSFDEDIT